MFDFFPSWRSMMSIEIEWDELNQHEIKELCVVEKEGKDLIVLSRDEGWSMGSGQQCIIMQIVIIISVGMHDQEGFDLKTLIASLTTIANPYSELTILALTPSLLHFSVGKALSSKTKTYRIICSPPQAQKQIKILAQSIKVFCTSKIVIRENNQPKGLNLYISDGQELWPFLKDVLFSQIVIEDSISHPRDILALVLSSLNTNKITFKKKITVPKLIEVTHWIHEQLRTPNIILDFDLKTYSPDELLSFVSAWVKSLPPSGPLHKPEEKHFGYPFPIADKSNHFVGRKEQINLRVEGKDILCTRQLEEQGRFLVLVGQHSIEFLYELFQILFSENKRISLEIEAIQGKCLVELSEFVVKHLEAVYRVEVGHQLQLTPFRMVLNTTDLTPEQVQRMMLIAAESGRYELTFYSDIQYLDQAVAIFLSKPLLQFDFLMPLEQTSHKTQSLLNPIQKHCRRNKHLAYSYAAMLNRYGHYGYIFISSVLHGLALEI